MSLQKITSPVLSPLKVKQSVIGLLQTRRPFEVHSWYALFILEIRMTYTFTIIKLEQLTDPYGRKTVIGKKYIIIQYFPLSQLNYICTFHNFQMILKFLSLFILGYLKVLYQEKAGNISSLSRSSVGVVTQKKDEECAHHSVKTTVLTAVGIII